MDILLDLLACLAEPRFILLVLLGAAAGLLVGAIPGLSVTMATALLVSITYSWPASDALAMVMGVYVVGVYSGAVSAILLNIPGAPSSVVTTLDGYPLAKSGQAALALKLAVVYSCLGSLVGLLALALLSGPLTGLALRFNPLDYFLLALFGLTAIGSLSGGSMVKGLLTAAFGLLFSCVGMDSVLGTPRLTFGLPALSGGVSIVPAMIGLFGLAEVLTILSGSELTQEAPPLLRQAIRLKELTKYWLQGLYYSLVGLAIGSLPGTGGPVASMLAYKEATRLVKHPSRPFGQGAAEGIVASEAANNACIGGALIPTLTLAIPGDAVTAVMLSVFYVHGLQPGPLFISQSPESFHAILASGLLASLFLLLLGLTFAPLLCKVIRVPKRLLLPLVAVLCVVGAFACNNRLFDVGLMVFFGLLGYGLRRSGFPIAPLVLGLVLGGMMDANLRRAISLASSEDQFWLALLGRPITIILLCALLLLLTTAASRFIRARRNHV